MFSWISRGFRGASSAKRNGKGRSPRSHSLRIEQLESRALLTSTTPSIEDVEDAIYWGTGPLTKVGDLAWLYADYLDILAGDEEDLVRSLDGFQYDATIGKVRFEAMPSDDAETLEDDLLELGATYLTWNGDVVDGLLPIEATYDLAFLSSLAFATPVYQPIQAVGAVDSQGDVAQFSLDVRQRFGALGAGITVGVISDSYNRLGGANADVQSADLPGNPNVVKELPSALPIPPIDEGRAMLQIVHDVVPNAPLSFHTHDGSENGMAAAIRALRDAGADVIVDDILFPSEPMFQDGRIAQAANEVVGQGIPYFSAAGNMGSQSYEAPYRGGTLFNPGAFASVPNAPFFLGGRAHDFDPGAGVDNMQNMTIAGNSLWTMTLQWDEAFRTVSGGNGAVNEMDIYILNAAGTQVIAGAVNVNVGADPTVFFGIENQGAFPAAFNLMLVHRNNSGVLPGPGRVKYVWFDNTIAVNEWVTNSSTTYGHANAAGAEAVGAAAYFQTPAFGANPPVLEAFSSRGGTPILFDTAGNALTTPEIRQKPEIVAPDGVNNTFFGGDIAQDPDNFPNFFGTSAAAPHAAGLAALMIALDGTLMPAQVYSQLEQTALDFGPTGFDFDRGFGLVRGLEAAYSVYTPGAPDMTAATDTGMSSTDNITNNKRPSFTGTVPAQSYVRLFVDGVQRNQVQLGAGVTTYTLAPTTDITDGNHSVTIKVSENSTSVQSNASPALPITIDGAAPSASGTPDLDPLSDTGYSTIDDITNDTTPTFNWTAATDTGGSGIDGYWWAVDDSTPNTGGTFTSSLSATPTVPSNGSHTFYVRSRDLAGNLGPVRSLTFTIDTVQPTILAASRLPVIGTTVTTTFVQAGFSESVYGVDASDLTLGSAGGVGAVVQTPIPIGGIATWRFPIAGLESGNTTVAIGSGITDAAGNSLSTANANWSFTHRSADFNDDDVIDRADLSLLVSNYGRTSGATLSQGDLSGDAKVNIVDLMTFRNNCDCGGGESLMGGGEGGGGGEEMLGGGSEESLGGGEEQMGGGGESLLSENPARIYITLSGSTSGGGELPEEVPSVLLDGPEDSVTLYVWANTGAYDFMAGAGLDIRATNENVVKATASTFYNPNIVATNYGNAVMGTRWAAANLRTPTLNPDGEGGAALAIGAGAFSFDSAGASGINDAWDGSDSPFGRLDELYDATNGAFLVQSITLEALAGSGGLSTDIVLYVGDMAFSLDNLVETSYLTFGLGETEVANNAVGETDGTAHATISVAAQGPSALVVRASENAHAVAGTNLVGQRRENRPPIRATAISAIRDSRPETLPAFDAAIEQIGSVRATRRALVGSRALARVAADGISILDGATIA